MFRMKGDRKQQGSDPEIYDAVKVLWISVLEVAVADVQKPPVGVSGIRNFQEAIAWINDYGRPQEEAQEIVNSFTSVCQTIGIDPEKARCRILEGSYRSCAGAIHESHLQEPAQQMPQQVPMTRQTPLSRNPAKYRYTVRIPSRYGATCFSCGNQIPGRKGTLCRVNNTKSVLGRYICAECCDHYGIIPDKYPKQEERPNAIRPNKREQLPIGPAKAAIVAGI